MNITVPIAEGSWYTAGAEPEPASRAQLLDLLSDVKGIMIRAHYHFDQDEVSERFDVRVFVDQDMLFSKRFWLRVCDEPIPKHLDCIT